MWIICDDILWHQKHPVFTSLQLLRTRFRHSFLRSGSLFPFFFFLFNFLFSIYSFDLCLVYRWLSTFLFIYHHIGVLPYDESVFFLLDDYVSCTYLESYLIRLVISHISLYKSKHILIFYVWLDFIVTSRSKRHFNPYTPSSLCSLP